jgi:hypothetical protein
MGEGARDDAGESKRLWCEGSSSEERVIGGDAVCDRMKIKHKV